MPPSSQPIFFPIFVDEIQRVPQILNEVHFLIEKTKCRFILTGSSARKLRRGGVNLLAGRAVQRRLFPFVYREIADTFSLSETLQFGTLPVLHGLSREENPEVPLRVICLAEHPYRIDKIQVLPWERYLADLKNFL